MQGRLALLILSLTLLGTPSTATLPAREIVAHPVWSFSLGEDEAIRLPDHANLLYTLYGNLATAAPYQGSGVVLYDSIVQKVTFLDDRGERLWAFGQVGDGPEDHRPPCELGLLRDGRIALVSLWQPVKIVFYENTGRYLGTTVLDRSLRGTYRIVDSADTRFIAHRTYEDIRDPQWDTYWEFFIGTINDLGQLVSQRLIKTDHSRTYVPGSVVNEREIWVKPRIEAGPRGTLIVQTDLYEPDVDIYDRDLNVIARIRGDWLPIRQTEEYMQEFSDKSQGRTAAAGVERSLPHIFIHGDSEIWLQKPGEPRPLFATYDLEGKSLGDLRITGLEGRTDKMVLHEGMLMTFEEVEDSSGGVVSQTFRLYRLDN